MPLTRLLAAAILLATTFADGPVWAQGFPQRPITLVVPYPPGGATDVSGRLIARTLSGTLGQPVVVENLGGAGGISGTNKARRARSDGYTIGLINRPLLVFKPTMDPTFNIEQGRDYIPLAMVAEVPGILVRHPDSRFKTLQELRTLGGWQHHRLCDRAHWCDQSGHRKREYERSTKAWIVIRMNG